MFLSGSIKQNKYMVLSLCTGNVKTKFIHLPSGRCAVINLDEWGPEKESLIVTVCQ